MIKKLAFSFIILVFLAVAASGACIYWLVAVEPGAEISLDNIRRILGRESPVFYSDGTTPLGVFFADAHRRYIDYREIPHHFVDALVAAEDNRFFSHFGFDVVGIVRAAVKNVQAGRIVQGGSTLTQQTAKNLFKREDRSFQAKFKELIFALRLEYRYSKEQILEFYANQFYVSGNGHGLGVAARYYFDKEPKDLTLVEAAFIAGSVKRPNAYNPFIQKGAEQVTQAKFRAQERARYVLEKMREMGTISDTQFRNAADESIPFRKGTVGFPLDYVMGMVTDAVASDRVTQALAAHGIDNIATSGIRIVTTVDRDTQNATMYALRNHLSYLDVRLRGYARETVQQELQRLDYAGDQNLGIGSFLFGTVSTVSGSGEKIQVAIDLGGKNGSGIIDRRGFQEMTDAWAKWRQHRWSEPEEADFRGLLAQIKAHDRVWVSVREFAEDGTPLLDLERFPEVQGAAMVMRKGRIMAVAGGVENRFFNRAIYGKRTMGSAYKPFVYTAALQLGWNAADLLSNRRDIFTYQNQPYFPRPDHAIEYDTVSLNWAGVKSENLASVWLTAHLCDHLSSSEFLDVAGYLGLTPRIVDGETESYRLFQTRIRDRYGIVLDQKTLRQAAYHKILQTIGPDLVFEGLDRERDLILSLPYGLGFQAFLSAINNDLEEGDYADAKEEELRLRRKMLRHSFLALGNLRQSLAVVLGDRLPNIFPTGGDGADASAAQFYYIQSTDSYAFIDPSYADSRATVIDRSRLLNYLLQLGPVERAAFIGRIKLGGILSVAAFDFVDRQVSEEFEAMNQGLPYSMEILEHVEDFRTLVGLHYLLALGESMGIRSGLEPVLSFPLGSNSVTLLETTRVYESLVSGETNVFVEEDGDINESLAIIDRIENEDGVVLYRPEVSTRYPVAAKTSLALGQILENTVKFGTGRYADQQVKLTGTGDEGIDSLGISIPLLGKTGTANRYTNASFYGYLPMVNTDGGGLTLDDGYSVGVYVGYDDNKPMRHGSTRVTGSLGALPAWSAIVKAVVTLRGYARELDTVDLSFNGLNITRPDLGQKNLAVNPDAGGVVERPATIIDPADRYHPSIMTFGTIDSSGEFVAEREFRPFWLADGTERLAPLAGADVAR